MKQKGGFTNNQMRFLGSIQDIIYTVIVLIIKQRKRVENSTFFRIWIGLRVEMIRSQFHVLFNQTF